MIRTLLLLAFALLASGNLLLGWLEGAALPMWAAIGGVCVVGGLWTGAFGAGAMALAAGVAEILTRTRRAFGAK